ncbi:hypothetical protein K474DRAFT_1563278, partial [Panus rudis PR-1116 ss-1]
RLISFLSAQLSRQHRTFTFSLCFFGRLVRFLRFDNSGVVVSVEFNYIENPRVLAEFFWRYSHMLKAERGFDPCVVSATESERKLLTTAVSQYLRHVNAGLAYQLPKMRTTLAMDYPAYKVTVVGEYTGRAANYIIRKPFTDSRSAFGRGTRGYVALELDSNTSSANRDYLAKKLVFLKDAWRLSYPTMDKEALIYDVLQEKGVPHLPVVHHAGDVYSDFNVDKIPQTTVTQTWANTAQGWKRLKIILSTYVHHRTVQKLAFPLESISHAKQLVQVVRDALESESCLISAFLKIRRLHRDISTNNIMIQPSEDGDELRGILNDWDVSTQEPDVNDPPTGSPRVGTWRFMSINRLENPVKPHEIHDDLESVLWVMLYFCLRH